MHSLPHLVQEPPPYPLLRPSARLKVQLPEHLTSQLPITSSLAQQLINLPNLQDHRLSNPSHTALMLMAQFNSREQFQMEDFKTKSSYYLPANISLHTTLLMATKVSM